MKMDKWKFGRHFLIWNFWLSWLGIFGMLYTLYKGSSVTVISEVFSSLTFNLAATLAALIGGKSWEHFTNIKWGNGEDDHVVDPK